MTRYHDGIAYGHPGIRATEEKIKRLYHWTNLHKDVTGFIGKCPLCQHHKTDRSKKDGPLKPLPIPE